MLYQFIGLVEGLVNIAYIYPYIVVYQYCLLHSISDKWRCLSLTYTLSVIFLGIKMVVSVAELIIIFVAVDCVNIRRAIL